MSKEREYPDWWIKQREDELGKDNEWLNFIKKHDRIPTKRDLDPNALRSTLDDVEDLDEMSIKEINDRMEIALNDMEILSQESYKRLVTLRIASKRRRDEEE